MAAVFPFVMMGVGALAAVRGLFRPHRAVVREGGVAKCSSSDGSTCDPADMIATAPGTDVFAVAPGRVVSVGPAGLQIVASNEPLILVYDGVEPAVSEGHHVGRGEVVGVARGPVVRFATLTLFRGKGGVGVRPMPPSAWLAARGLRHAVSDTGSGGAWCEEGRRIRVPATVQRSCEFALPEPAGFMLFPVEIGPET